MNTFWGPYWRRAGWSEGLQMERNLDVFLRRIAGGECLKKSLHEVTLTGKGFRFDKDSTKIWQWFGKDLTKIWQYWGRINIWLHKETFTGNGEGKTFGKDLTKIWKRFDKDLKKIWQRFNKPWAGIDIIMLVRLTILKMLTMLTMLMILTTNLDNKSWQQILTANLDDRFWQPISWIDCWLPYSALFRVTSATIFT